MLSARPGLDLSLLLDCSVVSGYSFAQCQTPTHLLLLLLLLLHSEVEQVPVFPLYLSHRCAFCLAVCVCAIGARYLRTQQQQHNPGFQENINDNSKKEKKVRCRTHTQIGMHKSECNDGWQQQ